MERKRTRGRPAKLESEKKKLKQISFAIDSELFDHYNEIIKEETAGTKKNGACISLNTFIKNNLDAWLEGCIKDITASELEELRTENKKLKKIIAGIDKIISDAK